MDGTAFRRVTTGQDGIGRRWVRRLGRAARLHLAAAGTVTAATGIGLLLSDGVSPHDEALVLLTAAVISAVYFGPWAAVTAWLLCIASYDYFFLPPLYSFILTDAGDVVAMACFVAVTAIVSSLAVQARRQARAIDTVRLQAETERLRSALLTSVSHDLRTPLAYIIGALSTLRSFGGKLESAAQAELIITAQDEAERLDRYVGNLLDMTRLESGALSVTLDTVALDELVSAALSRAHPLLGDRPVELVMPEPPPLITANFPLLEQMLFNLLDNAAKYAPAGSLLTVTAAAEGGWALLSVSDEGAGLPAAALDTVFDRFTRLSPGSQPGAGLGLAICRGFATAMGGTITAANRTDRSGAIFTITLKLAA